MIGKSEPCLKHFERELREKPWRRKLPGLFILRPNEYGMRASILCAEKVEADTQESAGRVE